MRSLPLLLLVSPALGPLATPQEGRPDAAEMDRMLAEANAASREIAARTDEARTRGNALTVLEALRELEGELADGTEISRTMLHTEMATLAAQLGDVGDALRYGDLTGPPHLSGAAPGALDGWHGEDALDVLARVAAERQVVMVNEAHHVPQHRAFTLRLLARLRAEGFTHFAAEALFADDGGPNPRDRELEERGYPTLSTGTYVVEPVFGELVRTALALGYRVVAYESASSADRELGQATRLAERVFGEDPDAKLLVHVGYGHLHEAGSLAGRPPMAARFRELTGIDPFTVDQTTMTEHALPAHEEPLWREVVAGGLAGPTLFTKEGRVWSAAPGQVDATLFSPRTHLVAGRPDWLRLAGARHDVPVPRELLEAEGPLLVQAWSTAEEPDAVPLDRIEVADPAAPPVLLLPAGEFRVVTERADGTELGRVTLAVPAAGGSR